MKTTDEIMEMVERHVKVCVLVRQDPVYATQVALTGEKLRLAIDDMRGSVRDEIAMHLPATPGGIDADTAFLITGKQITLDMSPLEQVKLLAQAEAKLRYIRADAMLAARGEV